MGSLSWHHARLGAQITTVCYFLNKTPSNVESYLIFKGGSVNASFIKVIQPSIVHVQNTTNNFVKINVFYSSIQIIAFFYH